jgi:hypothetical protein
MPSGWVLVDLLTKKIKLRCIKSTAFFYIGTLPVRIRISIEQSALDPYQIDKQDPDPYQNGLNPQHCSYLI